MNNNLLIWFKSLPVEKKLTVTVFATTAITLAIMSIAITTKAWISGVNNIKTQLTTHALVVESKATGALLFEDKDKAKESLEFLRAYPTITGAQIINHNGTLFGTYNAAKHPTRHQFTTDIEGYTSKVGHITLISYLYLGEEKIGAIHITSDYSELYKTIGWHIGFTLLVMLISLFISIRLASIPKKIISKPITELCNIVGKVSKRRDYSIRAKKTSDDEIGTLVDKFNEMLEVIENNNLIIERQTKNLLVAQSLAKVGNWEWDSKSNQVTLSKQALQILDLPSNIELPPLDFLINRLDDEYSILFKEAVGVLLSREQRATTIEYQIETITGATRRLVDELSVEYNNDGGISKIVGVTQDITDRKKIDEDIQRAQKLDSIGLLAGGIAHDFNNILTMIMGHISLAKIKATDNKDNEMYNTLSQSEEAAYRAKDLTQQLITFSKGNLLTKETIHLKPILNESANMSFSGSKVIHILNYTNDIFNVSADQGQIRQVVNNIYLNAKQSMPNGGLVTTTCEQVMLDNNNNENLKPGQYIKISIKDEGTGIEKKNLKIIFDPYYTTKTAGHGLGLSTCYSIIKNHDGTIEVNSEFGKGSIFSIYLPATSDDIVHFTSDSKAIERSEGKVLLMDDEESIGEYIIALLTRYGYTVDHVLRGEDTIEYYNNALKDNNPYKVVILDLTIKGGLGGRETIEKLLEIDPDVQAIVSSGYSQDPIMVNYKKFGFKTSVSKPYMSKEILLAVDNLVNSPKVETKELSPKDSTQNEQQ